MAKCGAPPPSPQDLAARTAIIEVVYRYARCLDRLDFDGMLTCWHPGGIDNRPPLFRGLAVDFVEFLKPTMRAMDHSTHVISNTVIALAGDRAGVESYYTANLRITREGKTWDVERNGRYLDRFALRDGVWAIEERNAVSDWTRMHQVDLGEVARVLPTLLPPTAAAYPPLVGQRDQTDLSYYILRV